MTTQARALCYNSFYKVCTEMGEISEELPDSSLEIESSPTARRKHRDESKP